MNRLNKEYLLLVLIFVVALSGCTTQPKGIVFPISIGNLWNTSITIIPPSQPYLLSVDPNPNFVKAGDTLRLQIQIINPLSITVNTQLVVQIDTDCFYVNYFNSSQQINNKTVLPQIVTLTVGTRSYYYDSYSVPEKCIGTDTITAVLKNASGNILDFKTVSVNVARS